MQLLFLHSVDIALVTTPVAHLGWGNSRPHLAPSECHTEIHTLSHKEECSYLVKAEGETLGNFKGGKRLIPLEEKIPFKY